MPLLRYNAFPETEEFPAGVRLFQDTLNRLLSDQPNSRPWAPPVDIFETENELVLKADLPAVKLEDIDIQLENGTLTLKGERRFEKDENNKGFHRIERSYGSFVRYFTLPETVDAEHVQAAYDNGVLSVTLPKKEVAKPRSIKVQVNNN
ncbi:MAG: Hsp20/alpha crystallin family protein [Acidobacteriota bacterium]|nr:Hsp20/alpha crystallin family protein [Acidobacteriota bacterium]